jgi:hypothetical protein
VYGADLPSSFKRNNVPEHVSSFTLNTPPELIKSVLGIPSAIRDGGEAQVVFYSDDESGIYVADYRADEKRVGLFFLSLEKPIEPFPLQKPISETTLSDTVEKCGSLTEITAHANTYSSTCGGSEADGRLYYRFFFSTSYEYDTSSPAVYMPNYDPDKDPCSIWRIRKGFDLTTCPNLAKWPAVAVLVTSTEEELEMLSKSILYDFDFGELFT